jgi:hypothetical protein
VSAVRFRLWSPCKSSSYPVNFKINQFHVDPTLVFRVQNTPLIKQRLTQVKAEFKYNLSDDVEILYNL